MAKLHGHELGASRERIEIVDDLLSAAWREEPCTMVEDSKSEYPLVTTDLYAEIERWYFGEYFNAFVVRASGRNWEPEAVLHYYAAPCSLTSDEGYHCLLTEEAVIDYFVKLADRLAKANYAGADILDRRIDLYGRNSAIAQAVWSRLNDRGGEIERVAVMVQINRTTAGLRVTAATSVLTSASLLKDAWIAAGRP
jgi:hypothetical protein